MHHGPPRRRRARPVGDAPIDALLGGIDELAKGWLLALLEQVPLDAAPNILAADLARDGPRICDAVVRALADENDLRRLEPGGALEPLVSRAAAFAASSDPASIARGVDALQGVVWSALRAELPWPEPEQISDLAERLALVCELVRGAALAHGAVELGAGAPGSSGAAAPGGHTGGVGLPGGAGSPGGEGSPAVREDLPGPRLRVTTFPSEPESAGPAAPDTPRPARPESPRPSENPRGERVAAGSDNALWIGAVEDEVREAEQSGSPLSLLLAEMDEGDRVQMIEPPREAGATFGRFAQAVRSVVRREDILACETDTRAWIIARDTGRRGAYALAERVAGAVEEAPPWRGAPMTVSVGLAVFGEDGRDATALIEAAEEAKFAAAASGVKVMPAEPASET
jgi:GGDEF domain-containing protein